MAVQPSMVRRSRWMSRSTGMTAVCAPRLAATVSPPLPLTDAVDPLSPFSPWLVLPAAVLGWMARMWSTPMKVLRLEGAGAESAGGSSTTAGAWVTQLLESHSPRVASAAPPPIVQTAGVATGNALERVAVVSTATLWTRSPLTVLLVLVPCAVGGMLLVEGLRDFQASRRQQGLIPAADAAAHTGGSARKR
eukprot:ctg_93.g17